MEYLQTWLDNSEIPIITAFLLGLLTAVSPCPLATNITAIGFISKDINNRNRIFTNGVLYTLGRVLAYSALGAILIAILRKGADMFAIQKGISEWGELLLAPALMLIGLFMLFGDKLQLPKFGFSATEKTEKLKGSWGSLLLGILFAMAFCPTSGLFYFGMLIPMSAMESEGYLLPVIFALATGLPVMLVAWILAYSVAGIGKFYNRVQTFQKWFNKFGYNMKILILCTGNSCRSQMAHGFLQSFDKNIQVYSAGTHPAEKVNPLAVKTMAEVGIDISKHIPTNVTAYLSDTWDYVITVCGSANETCPAFEGNVGKRLHIGFDDPSEVIGTTDFIRNEFERVRNEIKNEFAKFYITEIKKQELPKCACNR